MEQNTNLIMFALLRSAIDGEPISDNERKGFSPDMIPELYMRSDKQDLAHIIGYALGKNGLIDEENEFFKRFQKKQFQAVYRQEQSEYELDCIRDVFEREGIPFIPLKGAVIRKYYPEPWLRTSCDIDVLVKYDDIPRARDTLTRELEYTVKGGEHYHDISLFSPSGVHLELHFNIKENMESIDPLLDRVWDYAPPVGQNKAEHIQTGEYLMFHILAHTSYHFVHGGCGVKPFVDLYVLERSLGYDREKFKSLCASCDLNKFLVSAEVLTGVWFAGKEHSEFTKGMERYILTGGAYGTKEQSVAVESGKQGGKVAYIIGRIFMPYDMLRVQYPVLKKHPYLLPFCHICRWSRLIFKGKMKRSVNELKMTADMDSSRADAVAKLMRSVGLD